MENLRPKKIKNTDNIQAELCNSPSWSNTTCMQKKPNYISNIDDGKHEKKNKIEIMGVKKSGDENFKGNRCFFKHINT